MPVTEPRHLANPGRNGDTEETAITNDPANKGFPARLHTGELVFIVDTRYEHQKKVLFDADGNRYLDDGVAGLLVPYQAEDEVEAHEVSAPADQGTDEEAAQEDELPPAA